MTFVLNRAMFGPESVWSWEYVPQLAKALVKETDYEDVMTKQLETKTKELALKEIDIDEADALIKNLDAEQNTEWTWESSVEVESPQVSAKKESIDNKKEKAVVDLWINQKVSWFTGAINRFLNSPLVSDITAAMYSLMAMFGKKETREDYALESRFSEAIKNLAEWTINQPLVSNTDTKLSYVQWLKNIVSENSESQHSKEFKKLFIWASLEQKKEYIEKALKVSEPFNNDMLKILWKEKITNPSSIKIKWYFPDEPEREYDIGKVVSEWWKDYLWYLPINEKNQVRYNELIYDNDGKIKEASIRNLTLQKDNKWNVISWQFEQWKKNIDMNIKIPEGLVDDDKFGIWKDAKLWNIHTLIKEYGGDNEEYLTKVLIKFTQDLDKLSANQRSTDNLQDLLSDLKTEITKSISLDKYPAKSEQLQLV